MVPSVSTLSTRPGRSTSVITATVTSPRRSQEVMHRGPEVIGVGSEAPVASREKRWEVPRSSALANTVDPSTHTGRTVPEVRTKVRSRLSEIHRRLPEARSTTPTRTFCG